jgi:hypothetical protein
MPELCTYCDNYNACPHAHKPPAGCPAYEWDGYYTSEEEAEMEEHNS